jgi:N-acetylglucosaminyldiphosphoundecaprenol N-acetyl-beta-D-mannosaminyltransferase
VISDRTYWLLGLPFDAVDMEEAVRRIRTAAASRQRMVFVTPNVNFVSMADADAAFRQTILASQLSLVDGMPLVWLGRQLGIPFPERVAGSSVLERLARERVAAPLKVYFFGGEPGVSELAARRIQDFGPGLVAVGFCDPGFGSIDSMSTPAISAQINRSGADLLILSLGAKKGHQWIARNHASLEVPVITHLGAAVNFIAGTVRRAPAWMQRSGLEWTWRIRQEPKLFRRYWTDGLFFLRALRQAGTANLGRTAAGTAAFSYGPVGTTGDHWMLNGSLAAGNTAALNDFLQMATSGNQGNPTVDLSGVTSLDAQSLGLLYSFQFRRAPGVQSRLVCSSTDGLRLLRRHGAECLLSAPGGATALLQQGRDPASH